MTIYYTTDKVLAKVKKSVAYHFYPHYNRDMGNITNKGIIYANIRSKKKLKNGSLK